MGFFFIDILETQHSSDRNVDELRAEGGGEAACCLHLLCVSLLLSSFPAGKHSPCTTTEVSIHAVNLLSFVCFLITCLDRFVQLSVGVGCIYLWRESKPQEHNSSNAGPSPKRTGTQSLFLLIKNLPPTLRISTSPLTFPAWNSSLLSSLIKMPADVL